MTSVKRRHLHKCERGESEGDMPPSEAGRFCIFESPSVQFGEYFLIKFRQNIPILFQTYM